MTRIALLSDFHVNHWTINADVKPKVKFITDILDRVRNRISVDKIVIAGDLWNGSVNKEYDFGDDVIYINGNHDYYFREFPDDVKVKMDTFGGVNLSATTLWTNFWNIKDGSEVRIFAGINDNYQIDGATSDSLRNRFEQSWKLIRELDTEVVVTHYPPSLASISDQYWGNPYNPYFVNDKTEELVNTPGKTRLWLCGHVHHKHAYYINNHILVACNPLGYPGENYNSTDEYEPMILENDETGKWRVVPLAPYVSFKEYD